MINNFSVQSLSEYKGIFERESITDLFEAQFSSGYDTSTVIEGNDWDMAKSRRQRNMSMLASWLKNSLKGDEICDNRINCAIRKLSDFVELMDMDLDIDRDFFEIETLIEDSIAIRFRNRRDLKLNIYYDEEVEEDDSFDEAYVSYKLDGIRYVENNTIFQAVKIIKKLLKR